MLQLSKNFVLSEFVKSATALRLGIDNTPSIHEINNLTLLCENVLQPLRDWYGKPITISSGYRCPALCEAVGSTKTSQHSKGEAVDIDTLKDNLKLFEWIVGNLEFDQLIYEFGCEKAPAWIHISYKENGNRKQVLKSIRNNGKVTYLPYF